MLREIVYRYDSVTSTNDVARELAEAGAEEGTTVVAAEQTAGRGRYARRWHSPKGEGLYHSIILRPTIPPARAPLLGAVAAVALAETLREEYGVAADIKWPNDVMIGGRKVAGILMELEADEDRVRYIILGVGVNINQVSFPEEIADAATSVRRETGMTYDPEGFRRRFFARLQQWYEVWKTMGEARVLERYMALSSYVRGQWVNVLCGDRRVRGRTCGLTPAGALLVETEGGGIEAILAGDVTKLEVVR
ncbi:Bifunctional ligase/repressor BirA [bacterium HR10]|uniref:biotin--[biotin carboxyl-carrier protein] ligase n=1 Tax=uncultured Acidobacteriota bacterium TaxID=171953 RepID=H5SPQ5_9BACT|nr:BirA family transcriptional regulator, biotin operon repressor / biotin-[acetyl-CoA-carboxylase] ligase [uncultured Acidobacteriota bacterium]GBC81642.1 Bifunctional ligase/repressor BirA [bacterium HR10]